MYILINRKTGEIKQFTTFDAMKEWWKHLTINESFEWCGWDYVEPGSDEAYEYGID